MSDSLRPPGLQPTGLLSPWDFPGKNTRVGCHSLLQGIFPTQGSNLGLLHCRQILYHLSWVRLINHFGSILVFSQLAWHMLGEFEVFDLWGALWNLELSSPFASRSLTVKTWEKALLLMGQPSIHLIRGGILCSSQVTRWVDWTLHCRQSSPHKYDSRAALRWRSPG